MQYITPAPLFSYLDLCFLQLFALSCLFSSAFLFDRVWQQQQRALADPRFAKLMIDVLGLSCFVTHTPRLFDWMQSINCRAYLSSKIFGSALLSLAKLSSVKTQPQMEAGIKLKLRFLQPITCGDISKQALMKIGPPLQEKLQISHRRQRCNNATDWLRKKKHVHYRPVWSRITGYFNCMFPSTCLMCSTKRDQLNGTKIVSWNIKRGTSCLGTKRYQFNVTPTNQQVNKIPIVQKLLNKVPKDSHSYAATKKVLID